MLQVSLLQQQDYRRDTSGATGHSVCNLRLEAENTNVAVKILTQLDTQ